MNPMMGVWTPSEVMRRKTDLTESEIWYRAFARYQDRS